MNIPIERIEQEILVKRLEFNKYLFWAVRNESDGRNIRKGTIRKKSGVQKGVFDIRVILKCGSLLAIELKRQRKVLKNGKLGASPSEVSVEQIFWKEELNKLQNIQAEICFGSQEAIDLIEKLERA